MFLPVIPDFIIVAIKLILSENKYIESDIIAE
jgi:hypothetical protein